MDFLWGRNCIWNLLFSIFNNPHCDQIYVWNYSPMGTGWSLSGGKTSQSRFSHIQYHPGSCSYEELLDTFWTKAACKLWDPTCAVVTSCACGMHREPFSNTVLVCARLCSAALPAEGSQSGAGNPGSLPAALLGWEQSGFECSSPLGLEGTCATVHRAWSRAPVPSPAGLGDPSISAPSAKWNWNPALPRVMKTFGTNANIF